MLIKASQRASGTELALHLLNEKDNDHVEVHAINGFMDDDLASAFKEVEAMARGTRCTQYLFSVSFNPPKDAQVSTEEFEDAISRTAQKLKLDDQPYAIVFHEKHGRRHAHAVWSRIDSQSMTAINLPFYKNRLMELSKELYLEHNWELPKGHIDRVLRNPFNFSLEEWQQAKRFDNDPKLIRQCLQSCWTNSDNKPAFEASLKEHGFYLAKGDRRGFVAVDWRGEVYSLSRGTGLKTKALQERLGDPKELRSVDEVRENLDQSLANKLQNHLQAVRQSYQHRFAPLVKRKDAMKAQHGIERQKLEKEQQEKRASELQQQKARLRTGVRGLWDRVTGKRAQIIKQNEGQTYLSLKRDQEAKDALIHRQLEQRQVLQDRMDALQAEQNRDMEAFKQAVFSNMPDEKIHALEAALNQPTQTQEQSHTMEM